MQAWRGVGLGVAAMAVVVTASNILVQYPVGDWLTWGAFTYPFAFLVTDLANRAMGPGAARRVVLAGFALAVVLSIWLAGPRIAVASGTAFLVAQLLDVQVFHRLRAGSWWRAPLVSSTIGSALDTALFFSLAFAPAFVMFGDDAGWAQETVPLLGQGPAAALWVSLAVGDFLVKMTLALLALVPFRLALALVPARP
ncbi:VUT family protein [Paralimibaculum aggregatum]|uniref:Probable queuosine precursor transporter n=1 Tax=Paralimibaculum aggregatum TaxID=3036245 RepID=A0ABQ6LPX4_9RHOB|nr:queuosine precursor transporter [Limibaculum sp. NKW23]GMG84686.1 VUT family protein [Limibaculum sp. NKW23]